MELVDWFWQLMPDGRVGLRIVAFAILTAFLLVLALAVITSIATLFRGQPPWRWGPDRPFRRIRF